MKTVKLTPKASQDLEDIWYYGCRHFGEDQADKYINQISDIFQVMSDHNIGTPRPELGNTYCHSPLNDICFIFCRLILKLLLSVY